MLTSSISKHITFFIPVIVFFMIIRRKNGTGGPAESRQRLLYNRNADFLIDEHLEAFNMKPSRAVLALAADSVAARRRIKSALIKTPCLKSRAQLPENTSLYFKTENLQQTGSFKLRGAMSKLTTLAADTPLITASSGNHGIACSHAAMTTGHKLTVVLPESVAQAKLRAIEKYGTGIILHPGDSAKAEQHARMLAANQGLVYVSPYNDTMVMAGQGSIALELLEQLSQFDNVFVSMGGGGLISGIGCVIKAFSPATKVIGVCATNSAALAASIEKGHIVETDHLETLADGCAGGVDDQALTLPIASEVIDRIIHCSEEEIAEALRVIAWRENMLVEGAAALAMAGYLADPGAFSGQSSVVVLCGANFDRNTLRPIIACD